MCFIPPQHQFPRRPAEGQIPSPAKIFMCTTKNTPSPHHQTHTRLSALPANPGSPSLPVAKHSSLLVTRNYFLQSVTDPSCYAFELYPSTLALRSRKPHKTQAITSVHPAQFPASFSQLPALWCWQISAESGAPWQAGGISVRVENRSLVRLQSLTVTSVSPAR